MSEMKLTVRRDLQASAARVWEVLGDFGNLCWTPGPERVEVEGSGPGMIRRIFMKGMEPIDEILETRDGATRSFSYSIPRGLPLPLDNYLASVRVEELPGNCSRVHWSASATPRGVDAATASAILESAYAQMLDWLDAHLQSSSAGS